MYKSEFKIMNRTRILLAVFIIVIAATSFAIKVIQNPTEVIKRVSSALQNGNSKELSQYFTKTVELEIMGEENFYSISQAEILLKNFFEKNQPSKFTVNHQGIKDASSFAIGTLTIKTGNLRVSFFMKTDKDQTLIHQLRIEQNDEGANE
jgi:hypothetical protein